MITTIDEPEALAAEKAGLGANWRAVVIDRQDDVFGTCLGDGTWVELGSAGPYCRSGRIALPARVVLPGPLPGDRSTGGEQQVSDPDVRGNVERALEAGQRPEDIDIVVRARYAYQWGGGDALHLELANEVVQLRARVGDPSPDET
ncbi:MAG: hypothetical protein WCE30_10145 [Mycobacterium sp.]